MAAGPSAVDGLRTELARRIDSGDACELLPARLVLQAFVEAEVAQFLGRRRNERATARSGGRAGTRNGYQQVTIPTPQGAVSLQLPRLKGTLVPFASRLSAVGGVPDLGPLQEAGTAFLERALTPDDIREALEKAFAEPDAFPSTLCELTLAELGAMERPLPSWGQRALAKLEGPTAAEREGPVSDLGFGWKADDAPRPGIIRLTLRRLTPVVGLTAVITALGAGLGLCVKSVLAPPGVVAQTITKVTVPEGLRTSEVLNILAQRTHIPLRRFEQVASSGSLDLPDYARGSVEGLLFPATYQVTTGENAHTILQAMVTRFREAAAEVGLGERGDPLQTLTVASLAQAEGGTDADYPKITRVVYNRLARHARLQLDTTVLYAQRRRSLNVSDADTRVQSPYNTYRIAGLPPGPIDNPGEAALRAAVHPADGDWFWFVTTDPKNKVTKFTANRREFAAFREELRRNLSRG